MSVVLGGLGRVVFHNILPLLLLEERRQETQPTLQEDIGFLVVEDIRRKLSRMCPTLSIGCGNSSLSSAWCIKHTNLCLCLHQLKVYEEACGILP